MKRKVLKIFGILVVLLVSLPALGQRKVYFEKLELKDNLYYLEGSPYTGTSVLMHANKRVWQNLEWKEGKLDGWFKSYYENGRPEKEIEYKKLKLRDSRKERLYKENLQQFENEILLKATQS